MKKKRILSGAQPSGLLHIGNYFGMIRRMIDFQDSSDLFCFIANYHSLTSINNKEELEKNTFNAFSDLLALGLDHKKSTIWVQSHVPEVTELTWILSNFTSVGLMQRSTSYKDKVANGLSPNMGLFSYPVLMAADILLYDATHVPVGDDQKQHLELCRDIAQKFNTDFEIENFLQVPEPLIQKEFSRIMSLKDGSKKMSKSELSDLSRINLTDDKDLIINKIKKAKTDPLPMPNTLKELDERLEAKNLLGIYSSLTNSTLQKSVENFAGKNFSEFKQKLSEALVDKIEPISTEIKKLLDDKSYLDNTLLEGVERANIIASKKIKRIKEIVGF